MSSMANGRSNVPPPLFTPLPSGLLTVAQDATQTAPEGRWQAGVSWRSICPQAGITWDECLAVTGTGDAPEPPAKSETSGYEFRGATPFTAFAEIDCSPVGVWSQIDADVRASLTRSEGWQVERALWTGVAATHDGTGPTVVHPHLASDSTLSDNSTPANLLQSAADVPVTGIGEFGVDVVEGLSILETALGQCYHGQGVIHVTIAIFNAMVAQKLITSRGGVWTTALGNKVAAGTGYTGSGPDGSMSASVDWMYATGAVFFFRGEVTTFTREESLDRSVNTTKAIAERTYVIGWDCCHAAVPVTTGGEPAGQPGTPQLFPSA